MFWLALAVLLLAVIGFEGGCELPALVGFVVVETAVFLP